jgi:hypothetical protein
MKHLHTFESFLNEGAFKPIFKSMNVYDPLSAGQRDVFNYFQDIYFGYLKDLANADGKDITNSSLASLDSSYGDTLQFHLRQKGIASSNMKYDDLGKALVKLGYVKLSKKQEDRLAELGYDIKNM